MSEILRSSTDVQQNRRMHIAAILAFCSFAGCTSVQPQLNVHKDNNKDLTDASTDSVEPAPKKPEFFKIVKARSGLAKDETIRIILDIDNSNGISSFECPVKSNCLGEDGHVTFPFDGCDENPILNGTINCADFTNGCTEMVKDDRGDSGIDK
jgi:hypothetical protein